MTFLGAPFSVYVRFLQGKVALVQVFLPVLPYFSFSIIAFHLGPQKAAPGTSENIFPPPLRPPPPTARVDRIKIFTQFGNADYQLQSDLGLGCKG